MTTNANQRLPITIRLNSFEGPLDLLLYLIQTHELDISTVAIGRITDQYLNYVRLMQELNFDLASEFLVMAATLLLWKSQAILPKEETESLAEAIDLPLTQEELVRQLMDRQRFLAVRDEMLQLPRLGEDFFIRENVKPPVERVWRTMKISELALGLQDTLVRARKRKQILRKETVSLAEKVRDFAAKLEVGKLTDLKKLLSLTPTRAELVVTFLASLELARILKLKVYQEQTYAPILVELIETLDNLNWSFLQTFENIQAHVEGTSAETSVAESSPEDHSSIVQAPVTSALEEAHG